MRCRYLLSIVSLFILINCSSCATIFSGNTSLVTGHSEPPKATITITNRKNRVVYSGHTPATFRLKSGAGFFTKASYKVKFELEGFEESTVPIHSTINGWYFGNILIGGVVGLLIIDPATGAMWKIKNDFVDEKLVPKPNNTTSLKIIDIKSIPSEWKNHLIAIK
jgi:hypothetical protein